MHNWKLKDQNKLAHSLKCHGFLQNQPNNT